MIIHTIVRIVVKISVYNILTEKRSDSAFRRLNRRYPVFSFRLCCSIQAFNFKVYVNASKPDKFKFILDLALDT